MRDELSASELDITGSVWKHKAGFVRWPQRRLLFMPGTRRMDYYGYSAEQIRVLKERKIVPDRRSNGPAIMAFLLADGERPIRRGGKGWPIHHVYDGLFPFPGRHTTLHAVKEGSYFTEAAGLVAIHPIADGLAQELPYFAWLLRYEAWSRFQFDPDGVFQ